MRLFSVAVEDRLALQSASVQILPGVMDLTGVEALESLRSQRHLDHDAVPVFPGAVGLVDLDLFHAI